MMFWVIYRVSESRKHKLMSIRFISIFFPSMFRIFSFLSWIESLFTANRLRNKTASRNRICLSLFKQHEKLIIIHSGMMHSSNGWASILEDKENDFMTLFLDFSSINFTLVFYHLFLTLSPFPSRCNLYVLRFCNKSVLCMSNNLVGALRCENY